MTREQVLAMEAGRELDALVAVHVLGWRWESAIHPKFSPNPFRYLVAPRGEKPVYKFQVEPVEYSESHELLSHAVGMAWDSFLPNYSRSWEGMRLVVERLNFDGDTVEVLVSSGDCDVQIFSNVRGYAKASAATAPLAVCKAALLALEAGDACH